MKILIMKPRIKDNVLSSLTRVFFFRSMFPYYNIQTNMAKDHEKLYKPFSIVVGCSLEQEPMQEML